MISKKRQQIAREFGVSEKTYREMIKFSEALNEFEKNIGKELYDKFQKLYGEIYMNKKICVSNKDLEKVVTLPLNEQIEIAEKFVNNPNTMRKTWKEYFPQNTKITIEINENINELLTQQAKEKGMSKTEYTSNLVMLMTRIIAEDNKK